jgi:iron complex transport system ATP-binding protein
MSEGSGVEPPTTAAVAMRGACVRIAGRLVLGPIDLVVRRGERWVLLGPNGSGKTTLLALAGARRQPSCGRVTVLGATLGRSDVRLLHTRISHSSHVLTELMPPHLPSRTVVLTGKRSTLSPWFQGFDAADERRALHLLERVGCGHLAERSFATASQGERQRVLLARALFSDPELLILDEPAAGMDLPSREALIGALDGVSAASSMPTTMLATHHLEEVAPSTTHAGLLRDGRLIASGEIAHVLTGEALRACFGIDVEIGRRRGRWWATAAPPTAATP